VPRPRDLRAVRAYAAARARGRGACGGRSGRIDRATRAADRAAPPPGGARVSLGARSVSCGDLPQGRAAAGRVAGTGDRGIHVSSGRVRGSPGSGKREGGRMIPGVVTKPIAPLGLPDSRLAPLRVILAALAQLRDGTPETEFKAGVVEWLERWYRPEVTLADAFARALDALLGPRGLVVLRAHDASAKRAAAVWVLKGLDLTLSDGYTPVFVEARQGRDRLQRDGEAYVTRRSGERFTRTELERIAVEAPERLSPNVLLRPVVEAALLPTVGYAAGPAELKYLQDAVPLYDALGVTRQPPVPRWSGVIVEGRVEKLMERHGIDLAAFDGKPGELEARLVRHELPPETVATLAALKS